MTDPGVSCQDFAGLRLGDLPTPCLVLDRGALRRNLARMDAAAGRLGVALRPHLKTAKSIDIARMALALPAARRGGGIVVSTLAEAAYFAGHGIADMLLAIGLTPDKLAKVAALNAAGAAIAVVTDDAEMAKVIGAHPAPPRTLIEIDSGAHRAGVDPDGADLLAIAAALAVSRNLRAYEAHAHNYKQMGTLFERARVVADANPDDDHVFRELIRELGREALFENAEWLLDHRDRPVEPGP